MFEPRRGTERYVSSLRRRLANYGAHHKLLEIIGENKKVLDVGCASGYLSGEIKKKKCFVIGLDKDIKALDIAKNFCDDVICGDIEAIREIPHHNFDVILFADVLEHLVRPDIVLMKFKEYLSRHGFVLASIPNIAYIPCRLRLALGQFPYDDTGHFDKTHLRFFTLKTAKQLFESAGYRVSYITFTGAPFLSRIIPTIFAMKFIIKGEPLN